MKKVTEKQVQEALLEVNDPELNISIVDLGLVYKVDVSPENKVKILMTLTTIGCPLFNLIEVEVRNKLQTLGIEDQDIELELTFDPPWSMEKMTDKAKTLLGIL
jgi:metal-sulfur cluster biosynthetic enzyme